MDISKIKLNLTLACRWFPPTDQGGVAMHNGYLIQALKDRVNVKILTLEETSNRAYYEKQDVPFEGIQVSLPTQAASLAKTVFLKNGLRAWQDWRISLAMARALEASSPDVVEFMDIHSESYAYLKRNPKGKRKTKVVIRSHTPWSLLRTTYFPEEIKGVDGWWAYQREYFCFHACDAITTPSHDLKDQLIRIYQLPTDKIKVIPNLLDTEHFKPLESKKRDLKHFTFLHVGRYERAKGVITMTKAFIKVAKKFPYVRLINVGQPRGNALEICLQLLKKDGLEDSVEFTGFVDYEKLPEYYASSDAVIVPAEIYESFSYTTAQALACGRPVIASSVGGIPETVNYGLAGKIFPKGDYLSLTDRLIFFLENESKKHQFGQAGRQYCQDNFSLTALHPLYLNFYADLLT